MIFVTKWKILNRGILKYFFFSALPSDLKIDMDFEGMDFVGRDFFHLIDVVSIYNTQVKIELKLTNFSTTHCF